MTRKIIITGGPHTGKTTLLEALRSVYPEAGFIPEPATTVIGELGPSIMNNPREFCLQCIQAAVRMEFELVGRSLIIQDRSLVDTIAYARLGGSENLLPDLRQKIRAADYTGALLCDFVGEYTGTAVRWESYEEAVRIHEMICDAYTEEGILMFQLPAQTVEKRVERAMAAITEMVESPLFLR